MLARVLRGRGEYDAAMAEVNQGLPILESLVTTEPTQSLRTS